MASRTFGREAVTPRYSCAWFGAAEPTPTPTTVIVLPVADAAKVNTWGGVVGEAVGLEMVIASAVRLDAATATSTPQPTSTRVCADMAPRTAYGRKGTWRLQV